MSTDNRYLLNFYDKNPARPGGTTFIPALGTQRQEDICEFEARFVDIAKSRPARLCRETLSKANKQIFISPHF